MVYMTIYGLQGSWVSPKSSSQGRLRGVPGFCGMPSGQPRDPYFKLADAAF